jgi:hypothetical protein
MESNTGGGDMYFSNSSKQINVGRHNANPNALINLSNAA